MELKIEDRHFILHHHKVAFCIEEQALLLTDLHLGKYRHFRANGLAIPVNNDHNTLTRLDDLITFFSPEKLIILGDLFHSTLNDSWKDFVYFRKNFPAVKFQLILGNHDLIDVKTIEDADIEVYKQIVLGNSILLSHYEEPLYGSLTFNISGHIHPGILLRGHARQSLRTPCFWLQQGQLILPAFGDFTGLHLVKPKGEHRIFTRSRSIINRDVRLCHPPGSVHIVEKILEDFKAGKESKASFWIQMRGKFILIEYFALRGEENEYMGTLEVSQDITELRKLEGEQRILNYGKTD